MSSDGAAGAAERVRRRTELAHAYEEVAIGLFAERGFHSVTVADIALAAGVTSRTLFRYFPTKVDLLLARPRRATGVLLEAIAEISPSDEPVTAVWNMLIEITVRYGPALDGMETWLRAAADVPEVVLRVQGERAGAVEESLTGLFARWMDVNPASDVRPRVLAAAVQASERAVLTHWAASGGEEDLATLFAVAFHAVGGLVATFEPVSRTGASPAGATRP